MGVGLVVGVAGRLAGSLARKGIIRGTAGRLLGGGAKQLPRVLPGAGAIGGTIAGMGRGSILRKGAGILGAGVGFEAGSRAAGALFGRKQKKRRRMNVANGKALNRALRRVEGFQKMVKRSFIVSDIKPRKKCR